MKPQGFSYLELDKNNKYNHNKALAITNTKTSERKPKLNILITSLNPKHDCVIGWKSSTILSSIFANKKSHNKLRKGECLLKYFIFILRKD
jgi:hypothetical protein